MEQQEHPKKPVPKDPKYVECPLCKGVGSYPYSAVTRMHCGNCNGHGYVVKGSVDETCFPHKMVHVANLGRCYNRYKCEKCGKVHDIDSSD